MAYSAGCTEITGPFEIQYEFSLATLRVKIAKCSAMQHRRGHDSCALSSSARDPPIRHLLICRPVTDGRRLLICTSIALVRLLFCTPITLVRRLLICTPITLLRRLLACIRTVRRLLVCTGSTRLLTCTRATRVRGLLTCTTTNHRCVIAVGNRAPPWLNKRAPSHLIPPP